VITDQATCANCKIPYEEGQTKGTNHYSWSFRPQIPPITKANLTAVLKITSHHNLCDENHTWQMEARVQVLLEAMDNNPPERVIPCDAQKLNSN